MVASQLISLEVDAQGGLAGAIARVFGGLWRAQDSEGCRVVDLRRGRSEVGVIEHVGEGGFEAHAHPLFYFDDFGQAEAYGFCAGALQDAESRIAEAAGSGGSGRECRRVEVVGAGLSAIEVGGELVGAEVGSAVDYVGVGLVVGIADARREPGAGFKQSHGA